MAIVFFKTDTFFLEDGILVPKHIGDVTLILIKTVYLVGVTNGVRRHASARNGLL